ncbi:MAG: 5'/3'-nucleotidase SurE [Candidatus Gastranaerophilales bacterium]|nr:5'/3'-nucleotidase SurE [Candidatus Gastranaerophilales bacterium]
MRILISNDDGINAKGIRTLAECLAFEHDVFVVAPDRERSAAGHALTLHDPLRIEEVDMGIDVARAWATSGTPGDCIKLGISAILDEPPDLIISGINHGPNLGTDVLYSGTVNAAMEGAVLGFSSIAISLASNGNHHNADFIYAANFILRFIPKIKEISFPKKTILNINIPSIASDDIGGIQITQLGTRMYTDTYEKRTDPRGRTYYWLAGEILDSADDEGTDITAVKNNRISITPITFEITNKNIMADLEGAFCDGKCSYKP